MNILLLSICIIDIWLVYFGILGLVYEFQNKCYGHLAEELINNTYDNSGGHDLNLTQVES